MGKRFTKDYQPPKRGRPKTRDFSSMAKSLRRTLYEYAEDNKENIVKKLNDLLLDCKDIKAFMDVIRYFAPPILTLDNNDEVMNEDFRIMNRKEAEKIISELRKNYDDDNE